MQGITDLLNGAADLVWYNSIRGYVSTRIDFFLENTLSGMLTIVGAIALTCMTVWIMVQGYMIVSGRSQEGIKGFLLNAFKSYLIIAVATGMAASTGFSVRKLTDDLTSSVAQVMTGDTQAAKCLEADSAFLGCKVDRNLQVMQATMNFVGQLDTADDPVLEDKKARAGWFVGVGTAGPALVTGTMLLMYKVMMSLFIGFGPLFILALLFKRTAPLFQKWLYYGIATIFSSMLLAVMSDISMDLVEKVAKSLFVANLFGVNTQGLMQAATQQLGLGLLLSTLLLSVPPMAGSFFNGLMGSFNSQQTQLGGMAGSPMSSTASQEKGFAQAQIPGGGNVGNAGGGASGGLAGASQGTTALAPSIQQHNNRVSQGHHVTPGSSDAMKPSGSSAVGQGVGRGDMTPLAPATGTGSTASQPRVDNNNVGSVHSNGGTPAVSASSGANTNTQPMPQHGAVHSGGGAGGSVAPSSTGGSTAATSSPLPNQATRATPTGGNTDVTKTKNT